MSKLLYGLFMGLHLATILNKFTILSIAKTTFALATQDKFCIIEVTDDFSIFLMHVIFLKTSVYTFHVCQCQLNDLAQYWKYWFFLFVCFQDESKKATYDSSSPFEEI